MIRRLTEKCTSLWRAYEHKLEKQPIKTQMFTSLGLWIIGDSCAQHIEGLQVTDWNRLGLSALFGFGFVGPVGHLWYEHLDSFTKARFKLGSLKFVSTKVFADMFLFGPFYTSFFFVYMTCMTGGTLRDAREKLVNDFPPTFGTQCVFWIPYQYINFWAVPVRHQLLMVNLAAILDTTFLSWANSQGGLAQRITDMLTVKQEDPVPLETQSSFKADEEVKVVVKVDDKGHVKATH